VSACVLARVCECVRERKRERERRERRHYKGLPMLFEASITPNAWFPRVYLHTSFLRLCHFLCGIQ